MEQQERCNSAAAVESSEESRIVSSGANEFSDWHYLNPEDCNESSDSAMSEAEDSIEGEDIELAALSADPDHQHVSLVEEGDAFVPLNAPSDESPGNSTRRRSVSFSRTAVPVSSKHLANIVNSGAESSDFVTLDPNERHTDSSPGPPFIRPNDVTGSNEETRDDVEGPSGCHDLFVNVKQGGIQNEAGDVETIGEGDEDGYQSECSSSMATNSHAPFTPDQHHQRSRNNSENQSLTNFLMGPRFFVILLIALISLGLGHLIGQGKLHYDQDDVKAASELREAQQMEKIKSVLSEQLSTFSQELQAERVEWQKRLQDANTLVTQMKHEAGSEERQPTKEQEHANEVHLRALKDIIDKYGLVEEDKKALQDIILEKVDTKSTSTEPNIIEQMSESLNATKKFLYSYLNNFQTAFKNLNLTSDSQTNMTQDNILNVSKILSMSEVVGNTVFEILAEKMATISDVKHNLTLEQVEEFANTHAEATVAKINRVVSKTTQKLSDIKDGISSNQQVQKLKREVDKTVTKFLKGAVSQWNKFTNVFTSQENVNTKAKLSNPSQDETMVESEAIGENKAKFGEKSQKDEFESSIGKKGQRKKNEPRKKGDYKNWKDKF